MTDELEPLDSVADETEPAGTIDVPGKGRLVDVSVVVAERKRIRDLTERTIREKEVAPLQAQVAQAQQTRDALAAAQPYVELVKQHPEWLKPAPEETQIPDDDAERYARRFELYDVATNAPDVKRAKAIMADNRRESETIARQAAEDAVGPLKEQTATQASRANFVQMAQLRDADGQPLVDAEVLAQEWAQLPPTLTQHLQVAETVLHAAIGKMHRQGKTVTRRTPVFTEAPGGGGGQPLTLTPLDKKLGLTEADLKASADRFVPGGMSVIGGD